MFLHILALIWRRHTEILQNVKKINKKMGVSVDFLGYKPVFSGLYIFNLIIQEWDNCYLLLL